MFNLLDFYRSVAFDLIIDWRLMWLMMMMFVLMFEKFILETKSHNLVMMLKFLHKKLKKEKQNIFLDRTDTYLMSSSKGLINAIELRTNITFNLF